MNCSLLLCLFSGGRGNVPMVARISRLSRSSKLGKRIFTTFGLALILAQSGCSSIRASFFGPTVDLAKTPVSSMAVTLPDGAAIAPGEKSRLVVIVTEPDGKVLKSEGRGDGPVRWKDLKITASIVTVNGKGVVSLSEDPQVSDGKMPHIVVTVPSHPGLQTELDIPVRYDRKYTADFSGSNGQKGADGLDGSTGSSGTAGLIDAMNGSPGGDGSRGGDGGSGENGGPGGDGPPVQVRVAFRAGSPSLLQVAVSARGERKLYLVDPLGGTLLVKSDGGSGGSGGKGGHGGRGGSGGVGTPNGMDGASGFDGSNGLDGTSGRGGTITVIYDPEAKPYLRAIHLSSWNGPAPIYREEPVNPLW